VSATELPIYRFAGCELDPVERRLLAHGRPVALTPKVFDTLVLLVERAGHVVSKDELMAALWPRGFVHESNLTKHIWLIRKALGDSEHDARCIETVPKLGYRFVAEVRRLSNGNCTRSAADGPVVSAGEPPRERSERDKHDGCGRDADVTAASPRRVGR
jgi:DNA-binding winged helix-turn-helix (wHTH) protein